MRARPIAAMGGAAVLVGTLATLARHPPRADAERHGAARMAAYLDAQVRVHGFSGAVLVARDGRIVFETAVGLADREHDVPNRTHTRFRIASMTKPFTAAAVLRLEHQGRLRVGDRVCDRVPDCPPAWAPLTLHHLLTHTGGIPSYTNFRDLDSFSALPSTPERLIGRFRDLPLEFAPGERFGYSNSGYALLGYIIERVSGVPYGTYLEREVLAPLGMKHSAFDWPNAILRDRARGYGRSDEGVYSAGHVDASVAYAAGGLVSTVEDLYRFDRGLHTDALLPAAARERLATPYVAGDETRSYGYGWGLSQRWGRRLVAHGGAIHGFTGQLDRYPDHDACVVVLSNSSWVSATDIARDLAAIAFGEPYRLPRERRAIRVDPRVFDAYLGEYAVMGMPNIVVERSGDRLMARPVGAPPAELHPESETSFFLTHVDATISFVRDEHGRVSHLIWNHGNPIRGEKVR